MDQKLTEEQQRSAHKIIVANRGDCANKDNYLNCHNCPKSDDESSECCANFPGDLLSPEFQAENLRRSQAWLDEHPATPQEPPKRRPKPDEMVVEAPVRVRLWDELVKDGKLDGDGDILFQKVATFFDGEMRKFCGTTHKIIKAERFLILDECEDWLFSSEMLDYVEPEKVVDPTPISNTHALRIIALEGQVDDLTKKLAASKKLCERLQRRLRANWEAKRDEEMATEEEIVAWLNAGKVSAILRDGKSTIRPNGRTDWIPATRGNLKL